MSDQAQRAQTNWFVAGCCMILLAVILLIGFWQPFSKVQVFVGEERNPHQHSCGTCEEDAGHRGRDGRIKEDRSAKASSRQSPGREPETKPDSADSGLKHPDSDRIDLPSSNPSTPSEKVVLEGVEGEGVDPAEEDEKEDQAGERVSLLPWCPEKGQAAVVFSNIDANSIQFVGEDDNERWTFSFNGEEARINGYRLLKSMYPHGEGKKTVTYYDQDGAEKVVSGVAGHMIFELDGGRLLIVESTGGKVLTSRKWWIHSVD